MRSESKDTNLTVIWVVALAILAVDALTGPMRFYLDIIGLGPAVYIPKAVGIFAFLVAIVTIQQPLVVWSCLGILLSWSVVGMLREPSITAPAFAFYQAAPFLLALVCPVPDERMWGRIMKAVFLLWVVTVVGVLLDSAFDLPWKGFETEVAGQTIEGNRAWSTMTIDRPAGFTRMSTVAAMYAAIAGLMLFVLSRRSLMQAFILVTTLATVLVTTNKSVIMGILGTLGFLVIAKKLILRKIVLVAAIIIAIALPLYSAVTPMEIDLHDEVSVLMLASFEDRLIETWPDFTKNISLVLGEGLGHIGGGVKYFDPYSNMSYADNYALYLIGIFGAIVGIPIFGAQFIRIGELMDGSRQLKAVGLALVMILFASVTTDVIETIPAAFMMGLGLKLIYGGSNATVISLVTRRLKNTNHNTHVSEAQNV